MTLGICAAIGWIIWAGIEEISFFIIAPAVIIGLFYSTIYALYAASAEILDTLSFVFANLSVPEKRKP